MDEQADKCFVIFAWHNCEGGPEAQIASQGAAEIVPASEDRSLDEIRLHWTENHSLLKHAIAEDSSLDTGDGNSFLFSGCVYK